MMQMPQVLYLEKFGKAFVPKKLRPNLKSYFKKAGFEEVPYTVFGILFWLSAAITYAIYLPLLYPQFSERGLLVFFGLTFVSWFVIHALVAGFLGFAYYVYTDIKIFRRTKNLEEKLPEYLNLVSVNLKGGMAFEDSLWNAIKPEFEVLAEEITIVSKSVMTGSNVKEALRDFAEKYDSPQLRRAMDLVIGEVEGGGRMVDVLDGIIDNLKQTKALKRELQVATTTYMIFISVIVIIIAPALFAVSFQLLQMVTGFTQDIGGSLQHLSLPLNIGESSVTPQNFKNFTYFALGIISFFSSMIVSIINKGEIKSGLKYIPMFIAGSIFFYFIFSEVMSLIFSGIGAG